MANRSRKKSTAMKKRATGRGRSTSKKRAIRWLEIGVLAAVAILALAIIVPNLLIVLSARGHVVDNPAKAPTVQTAIVLGAQVEDDGSLSPMLQDRMDMAVRLYKMGKVKQLLVSGANTPQAYMQVDVMRAYAIKKGVPARAVISDNAGFTTYATMQRARDVFHVGPSLIVTQRFHSARAVYLAQAFGIQATCVTSDLTHYPLGTRIKSSVREYLARVKAVFMVVF
jgi:SanA protein